MAAGIEIAAEAAPVGPRHSAGRVRQSSPDAELLAVGQPVAVAVEAKRIGAEPLLHAVGEAVVVGVAVGGRRAEQALGVVAEAVVVIVAVADVAAAVEVDVGLARARDEWAAIEAVQQSVAVGV